MTISIRLFPVFTWLSLFSMPAFAQKAADDYQSFNPRFEIFELPGGALGNSVQGIVQDSTGFLWFGSQQGLHRYDGQNIRTIHHDPANAKSIASDYVEYTFLEDQGNESTRVLEKHEGRWKLVRMGVINTTAYESKERLKQLHRLADKWTADMSTLKFEPPLQGWAILDFHFENTPTETGIRLTQWWNWKNDAGFSGKFIRRMEFATVAGSPELEMFAVESNSDGWSGVSHGTAKLHDDGNHFIFLPPKRFC